MRNHKGTERNGIGNVKNRFFENNAIIALGVRRETFLLGYGFPTDTV